MTSPAVAALRFCQALLLGAGLGLYYGFLQPLRPKRSFLSDLLFLPVFFWAWLYHSFALCGGDLRMGYCAGLILGIFWFRKRFMLTEAKMNEITDELKQRKEAEEAETA